MPSDLKILNPSPAVKVGAIDLLATEAGRTPAGLTAAVWVRNGRLEAGRRVCLVDPQDCAALDREIARATGLKRGSFAQPLLDLTHLIEEDLRRERRSAPAPSTPGARALTDMGNAERLVDRYGGVIRYCWDWHDWLAYDGTRWKRGATAVLMAMAKDVVRGIYREAAEEKRSERRPELAEWARKSEARKYLDNLVTLAQSEQGVPIEPRQFDRDPWLLNCTNGTLDLRTGELRAHRPEDLLTKSTGVPYDPQAQCPRFEQFMVEIMNDDSETISFLQRGLGYSITGVVREHCLFLPWGGGRNGKSKLLGTVQAALGDYALQAVSDLLIAKRFDSHPTERADLFGRRFVATIEVEKGRRLAEATTKQLSGGDPIRARGMRENFWQFDPTHKIWLATNHKPIVRGTDDGIWDRIHLIPFTVRFVLQQDTREGCDGAGSAVSGEAEVRATKPADPDLGETLRAELPGILAWLVRGCLAWQAEGLRPPRAVTDATQKYRDEMNILGPWIDECCVVNKRACGSAKDLFASFSAWCEANGEKPMERSEFGQALAERGFVPYRDRVAGKQARLWRGIGLPQPPDPPPAGQEGEHADSDSSSNSAPQEGVTRSDTSSEGAPRTTPVKEQTTKRRHNASHVSHPAQAPENTHPPGGTGGPSLLSRACDEDGVTRKTWGDGDVGFVPIGPDFVDEAPNGASQRVTSITSVSRDPATPHPKQPCPRGHHEWERARSDPGRGGPAWYGYICRHPECMPGDRYGCWLPPEACPGDEVTIER